MLIKILLVLVPILIFASMYLSKSKGADLENIAKTSPIEVVNIKAGNSAKEIAALFDKEGLLEYLIAKDLTSKIQVGKYEVSSSDTVESIANMITSRDEKTVLIYPGYTIEQIDRLLFNKGYKERFKDACQDFLEDNKLNFIEGWLLSGTYKVDSIYSLVEDMNSSLLSLIKDNSNALLESKLSVEDLVKIASIVNRETQNEEQMKMIARIILNRLDEDMPIGIDATTRYELNDWTNDLAVEDLNKITEYNTRRVKGLPPSGIGCPAPEAILAVLYPHDNSYLYYFHTKEGSLVPSYTYDEHLLKHKKYY